MNNNNSIDLVNTEEVNIFNDDGSVKETFIFPVTSPIVIMDSSDTETEEEEENDNEKEAQGEDQAAEEVAERKEAEQQQQAEQTATPEEVTAAVLTRQRTQVTAPAWIIEPTPQRAVRLNNNQSMTAPLQPAPSIAESESIQALEACLVQELPDLTDADIELMMSDTPF